MPDGDRTEWLELVRTRYTRLAEEVHRVIIGQDQVVQNLVSALFARGHCLLIGVPGLAKTLLVKTLAQSLDWEFKRIQFTPDLMPSDIIGTEILDADPESGRRSLRFVRGPIFANVVLADEINRTPPKTQSALLEAMQEYAVTVAGPLSPLSPQRRRLLSPQRREGRREGRRVQASLDGSSPRPSRRSPRLCGENSPR
jgi:MoxR-like ATPase